MVAKEHIKDIISEISVTGVPDCVRTKHKSVRIIWITMLIFGLALTVYFMWVVIQDYLKTPTVTKVYVEINQDKYPFPPTYLSIQPKTAWRNTSFADKAKFVVRSWDIHQMLIYSTNESEQIRKQNDYILGTNLLSEYAENLHLATVTDIFMAMDKDFYDEFYVFCERCNTSEDIVSKKVLVNNYITYEIRFDAYSKFDELLSSQSIEYGLGVYNPNPDEYSVLLRIGKNYQLLSKNDAVELKNDEEYEITVSAQKMIRYNYKNSCTTNVNRSYQACASECNYQTLEKYGNCTYVRTGNENLVGGSKSSSLDWNFCSFMKFDFSTCLRKFDKNIRQCYAECLPLCDEMIYQYTVLKNSVVGGGIWATFKLTYPHTGLLIFQENPSFNFQSAISNIGGQLGLWLGMSLITVVQVIMIFVTRLLNQCRTSSKPISITALKK